MRLNTDEELEMSLYELHSRVAKFEQPFPPSTIIVELRSTIKTYQRTRTLVLWHDYGTILGLGTILMTIPVAYDTATFYTQAEYAQRVGSTENVQSMVERPEIYMQQDLLKTKQLFCRTGLTAYLTCHCLFKHLMVFRSMKSWAS